jgi:hypothetical protein
MPALSMLPSGRNLICMNEARAAHSERDLRRQGGVARDRSVEHPQVIIELVADKTILSVRGTAASPGSSSGGYRTHYHSGGCVDHI